MLFNNFCHKYDSKKATSNIENYQVLSSLSLNDVNFYSGDGPISSDIRIINLRPSKSTQWLFYLHANFLDSKGCSPPQKFPNLS